MKALHEQQCSAIAEDEIEADARLLVQSVSSVNQLGGIAAHTVTAGEIHLNSGSGAYAEKKVSAVQKLWDVMLALRREFSDLVFVLTIFTSDELQDYFTNRTSVPHLDQLRPYADMTKLLVKWQNAGAEDAERRRPLVSPTLWQLFFAYRAILGRLAVLIEMSFKSHQYKDWRTDKGFLQIARTVIPDQTLSGYMALGPHALKAIFEHVESAFTAGAARLLGR